MGEVDRIRQIGPGPTITPRVGEGGQRRQRDPQEERRDDLLELHVSEEEPVPDLNEGENPVEEPYRLDIAI